MCKMINLDSRVFVQEPWDGATITFVGRVMTIDSPTTLHIWVDEKSSLTSPLIYDLAAYTGHSLKDFPVNIKQCTLMKESE